MPPPRSRTNYRSQRQLTESSKGPRPQSTVKLNWVNKKQRRRPVRFPEVSSRRRDNRPLGEHEFPTLLDGQPHIVLAHESERLRADTGTAGGTRSEGDCG